MVEEQTNTVKEVTGALAGVLARDNNMTRCSAMRALGRIGSVDPDALGVIVKLLLEDEDPDVRMDAALILGHLGGDESVEPLVDALKNDPMGDVRIQAVNSLIHIGTDKVTDVLIDCLELSDDYDEGLVQEDFGDDLAFNPNWEVQGMALKAMVETGGEKVVEPVIKLIENENYEDMYETAFKVLGRTGSDRAREFLLKQLKEGGVYARRRAVKALVGFGGGSGDGSGDGGELPGELFDLLTKALLDKDASVRIYAARALADSGDARGVVPITMMLQDKDKEVVAEAAALLGRIGGEDVVARLTVLLGETSWQLKLSVITILGEIGDPNSAPVVAGYLSVEDDVLQYEVVKAIGKIGESGSEEALVSLLFDEKKDTNLRFQAAWALGEILKKTGAEGGVERAAESSAGSSDDKVEDGEGEGEGDKYDPLNALVRASHDPVERVAFSSQKALVEVDKERALQVLGAILKGVANIDANAEAADAEEAGAAQAVGDGAPEEAGEGAESGGEGAQEVTEEESSEKSSNEEAAADDSVDDDTILTGESAVVELMRGVKETPNKEEISTLASIMKERANAEYDALQAQNKLPKMMVELPKYRLSAARLLGEIKDERAVSALIEASEQGDEQLQREAVLSLGHIGDAAALPAIAKCLDSEIRDVRMAALDSIEMLARGEGGSLDSSLISEHVAAMAADPDQFVRHRVVQVLGEVGGDEARELLIGALDDEAVPVRKEALLGLSRAGVEGEGREKIKGLIFSHHGELRREAAAALRCLEDFSATGELLDGLNDESREEEHWVCIEALAGLYGTIDELRDY